MEKIICDTNIWYNIAKKEIDEIELNKIQLIGTSVSIREILLSPNRYKNIDLTRRTVEALYKYHHKLILSNPIEHILTLFYSDYYPNTDLEDKLLIEFNTLMDNNKNLINDNLEMIKKKVDNIIFVNTTKKTKTNKEY